MQKFVDPAAIDGTSHKLLLELLTSTFVPSFLGQFYCSVQVVQRSGSIAHEDIEMSDAFSNFDLCRLIIRRELVGQTAPSSND